MVFIIECECNELVESEIHLLKMKKKMAKRTTFHGRTEITKLDY